MKRIGLILLLAGASIGAQAQEPCNMPTAYHEFVMFGNGRIYLSHYSMFHAIHAYQALIEVSLRKGNVDVRPAFFRDRAAPPERSYTVSPSRPGSPVEWRR